MNSPTELKDIHLPSEITWWPLAYGWWLLIAIVVVTLVLVTVKLIRHHKQNKMKRLALSQLKLHANASIEKQLIILKSVVFHYLSRTNTAALHGDELINFLAKFMPNKHQQQFKQLIHPAISTMYSDKSIDNNSPLITQFNSAAKLWIEHALPIKNPSRHELNDCTTIQRGGHHA